MPVSKLRRQIAFAAARLMHTREVAEYFQAKQKASRTLVRGWVKPADLPSNAEIREQVQILARMHKTTGDGDTLARMRLRALWWLRQLDAFHPSLIGSVLTGGIREGSDIDLHLFCNHIDGIVEQLLRLGVGHHVERKRLNKDGESRVFTHIHLRDEFPVELTVYPIVKLGFRFRSSITGKPIERAGADELEKLIHFQHAMPTAQVTCELQDMDTRPDRFAVFLSLLMPLENVQQNREFHPEGDALYHSLQVFDLAHDQAAYDEEFLLAALLHDIGKAIDPRDHVASGLEALDGFVTERTAWLIAHHMEAHQVRDRTIGARRRRHLTKHPWFDDLMCLNECDRAGRACGVETRSVEEALDVIEDLSEMFG